MAPTLAGANAGVPGATGSGVSLVAVPRRDVARLLEREMISNREYRNGVFLNDGGECFTKPEQRERRERQERQEQRERREHQEERACGR